MMTRAARVAAALAVTPSEVASLDEQGARDLFSVFRFPRTAGEPYCDRCGGLDLYKYKCRDILKCKNKGCEHRFSLTSGTFASYRKIGFRSLMIIMANFSLGKQSVSACELKEDLRKHVKNYKTVWTWLHKARDALATEQKKLTLTGEVEVDGIVMGGYIRPKNMQKLPTDLRKYLYRHPSRKVFITLARQRHGAVIPFVGLEEEHCLPVLVKQLAPGTHVFTDMGNWRGITDAGFRLHQVNHSIQFVSPESGTNWCESANNTIADIQRTHRHISSNYLDLYAAQAAWRADNRLKTPESRFSSLMTALTQKGRSGLAGHYLPKAKGGVQRRCKIIGSDGVPATWSPPQRAPRRPRNPGEAPTLRELRAGKRWTEGFKFGSARDVLADPKSVPFDGGVYALFVRSGEHLLEAAGYSETLGRSAWAVDGHRHIYTGESYGIRERVMTHLSGSTFASDFRSSLLSLHQSMGVLPDLAPGDWDQDLVERHLNLWIEANVIIGFKSCAYCKQAQDAMLEVAESPLNISDRAMTPFSRALTNMRQVFKDRVLARWQRPSTRFTGKRRPRR